MKRKKSDEEIVKNFGEKLKAIRENKKLSLKEAAAGLGMTVKRLSIIEAGSNIQYTTMCQLMFYYGIKTKHEISQLLN
jgi:transcriptional regulator with XRE-family HTH domain